MFIEEFDKLIINRAKWLSGYNACFKYEEIKPFAVQSIKEFLPLEVAQDIYISYDITLYDYIDYIIKKVLEE